MEQQTSLRKALATKQSSIQKSDSRLRSLCPLGYYARNDLILVIIVLFCALFPLSIAHAQDITTGLVGHWELDETSGAVITDSSGNGNTGTWTDGTGNDVAEETVAGEIGTAISFDAVDDIINAGNDASLNISDNTMTVSTWLKKPAATATGRLLYRGVDDTEGYQFGIGQSGCTSTQITFSKFSEIHSCFNGVPADTNWHHYAVVIDTTGLSAYVDGILTDTNANSANINASAQNAYIRNSGGTMDDLRIYSRALTTPDITTLYAYGRTCSLPDGEKGEILYNDDDNVLQYCDGTEWIAIGPQSNLSDGLVGHWELDETSGATITDNGSGGNDGTWSDGDDNDVTGETITGTLGDALDFDGANDSILIGDPAGGEIDFNATESFSYSTWVRSSDVDTFAFSKRDVGAGYEILVGSSGVSGNLSCRINDGGPDINSATSSGNANGSWHHVMCVVDRLANELRLYVDGTLIGTPTDISAAGSLETGDWLSIGARGSGNSQCDCDIDDVRIYGRSLSAFEVSSLHALGASCIEPSTTALVGHWALDEVGGAVIADSSGNGNTGTWTDNDDTDVTGETVAGLNGTALHFDGADDYITIADTANLSGGVGVTRSWSFWFNSDITPAGQMHVFKKDLSADYKDWGFVYRNDNSLYFYHENGNSNTDSCSFTPVLTPGTWYHITATFDGSTRTLQTYVNGNSGNSCVFTYDLYDSAAPVLIGKRDYDAADLFDGVIDDVRIYTNVLSPIEVSSLYGSVGGTCTLSLCSNPFGIQGEIVYNADFDVMQYCNGGDWIAMGPPGDGGSPCASPAGLAGTLRYDNDNNTLMYCEGDEWIAVSGH